MNRTSAAPPAEANPAPDGFGAFRDALRSALPHLNDPMYRPSPPLCAVLEYGPSEGPGPVQAAIIRAIDALRPDPAVPEGSAADRNFRSLHTRFVLGLSQEETAEQLHMSVRHVQRVQVKATHGLARSLWERKADQNRPEGIAPPAALRHPLEGQGPATQSPDWQSQAELELATLRRSEPGATADVDEAIGSVIALERALVARRGVTLVVDFLQPGLVAAVHPTVLRQVLITAVGRLARYAAGELAFHATLAQGRVRITLSGPTHPATLPSDDELTREVILPQGTSVEVHRRDDYVFLEISLPSAGQRTVLVVEDNPDMVHFFERCAAGTPYRIVHLARAQEAVDTIEATSPDIVVLDVMLPNADGWQLLTHLYERPATRSIPVIVCSVVKEEELALSLGATLFVPKPVHPRRFVAALDQAYLQAEAGERKSPENSAGAC